MAFFLPRGKGHEYGNAAEGPGCVKYAIGASGDA